MMTNEDSGRRIPDATGDSFLHDDWAETGTRSSESKSPTYVKTNMTTEFLDMDINETFSTTENARHDGTVLESNDETQSILESEKEKAESISKLESSYYELQAKLESAEVQRVRDQAEIDRLNSQVPFVCKKLI